MTDLQDSTTFFYLSNLDLAMVPTSGRENRLVVGSYLN